MQFPHMECLTTFCFVYILWRKIINTLKAIKEPHKTYLEGGKSAVCNMGGKSGKGLESLQDWLVSAYGSTRRSQPPLCLSEVPQLTFCTVRFSGMSALPRGKIQRSFSLADVFLEKASRDGLFAMFSFYRHRMSLSIQVLKLEDNVY